MSTEIQLSPADVARLMVVVKSLGTTTGEFVAWAVRQALDEAEALAREQQAIHDYYQGQ